MIRQRTGWGTDINIIIGKYARLENNASFIGLIGDKASTAKDNSPGMAKNGQGGLCSVGFSVHAQTDWFRYKRTRRNG